MVRQEVHPTSLFHPLNEDLGEFKLQPIFLPSTVNKKADQSRKLDGFSLYPI